VVTAGVRLLAVSVTETQVDAQGDVAARRSPTELVDHVGGATVYVNPSIDSQREGFLVEGIRRVYDGRWIAVWLVPRRERAVDFARADGILDQAESSAIFLRILAVSAKCDHNVTEWLVGSKYPQTKGDQREPNPIATSVRARPTRFRS
jgi:hypothetical protein